MDAHVQDDVMGSVMQCPAAQTDKARLFGPQREPQRCSYLHSGWAASQLAAMLHTRTASHGLQLDMSSRYAEWPALKAAAVQCQHDAGNIEQHCFNCYVGQHHSLTYIAVPDLMVCSCEGRKGLLL
jgi:hypothetical protein